MSVPHFCYIYKTVMTDIIAQCLGLLSEVSHIKIVGGDRNYSKWRIDNKPNRMI